MGERQPDVQRHQSGLGASSEQNECKHESGGGRRMLAGAHRHEVVGALGAGEQPEGEQQGERAEARHD
jgi:hypothetical protein